MRPERIPSNEVPQSERISVQQLPSPLHSWWQTVGAGAVALALGLGLLATIWLLAQPLVLVAFGITLAEAISPLVSRLERWLPRTVAIVLIYLAGLAILSGIFWIIAPDLVSQAQDASTRLPDLLTNVQNWLAAHNLHISSDVSSAISSQIGNISTKLVSLPITIFSSLLDIVLVFFISVYWLIDVPDMRGFLLSLFPASRGERVDHVLKEMGRAMGGFIRGAVLNGLIIGLITYLGLLVLDIHYALTLGLLAGLLEFIPFVGPVIAAVPLLITALLQSPTKALFVLIFVIALHQVEGDIVVPNIMYSQTEISPVMVLLAVLAGSALGGPFGAIIAIPLAAALRVFIKEMVAPAIRQRTGATDREAETESDSNQPSEQEDALLEKS